MDSSVGHNHRLFDFKVFYFAPNAMQVNPRPNQAMSPLQKTREVNKSKLPIGTPATDLSSSMILVLFRQNIQTTDSAQF